MILYGPLSTLKTQMLEKTHNKILTENESKRKFYWSDWKDFSLNQVTDIHSVAERKLIQMRIFRQILFLLKSSLVSNTQKKKD